MSSPHAAAATATIVIRAIMINARRRDAMVVLSYSVDIGWHRLEDQDDRYSPYRLPISPCLVMLFIFRRGGWDPQREERGLS